MALPHTTLANSQQKPTLPVEELEAILEFLYGGISTRQYTPYVREISTGCVANAVTARPYLREGGCQVEFDHISLRQGVSGGAGFTQQTSSEIKLTATCRSFYHTVY